jgi:hypothetical protein
MAEPTEFEKLMQSYQKVDEPSDFDKLMQTYQNKSTAAPVINLPKDITGLTETDLAKLYTDSRSAGFNDAQIRDAANARYGKQSDTTWDYLTSLAGFAPPSANAGVVGEANKGVVAGPTSLTTDPLNFYTKQFQGKDYSLDTATVDKLTQQILAQNTTSKWSGEGWGSAQANARAMAENLYASGVKDIKEVGLVDKTVDEAVTPIYEYVNTGGYDENGPVMEARIVGYKDSKGNPVDAKLVTSGTTYSGGDAGTSENFYAAPIGIQKLIGNKTTGQTLIGDYDKSGSENIWSGTTSGKGNTAYRVHFDDKGNPYFYTTGHSSNDLVNLLGNDPILNAIAQIGASYFGGPAGSAALNAAMGKNVGDIAKSYILSQLGQEAFKGLTTTGAEQNLFGETGANFAKDIKDVFGKTGADIVGKTAGSFIAGGGNVDLGSLLVNQGVGAATTAVLGEIPGFDGLNATEKKFVTNIVSSTLNDGKLSANEAISAAFSAATQAMKNTSKTTKVAGADGDDEFQLPGGTQVAGPYSIDVAGVPLFQESVPAGFTPPAGLRLLSASDDIKEVYDSEGNFLKETKPVGSYIDYSLIPGKGVWVVKEDAVQKFDTGRFADDIAMFYQNQGDLDKIASATNETSDDYVSEFLKSIGIKTVDDLKDSKLSNQDILDLINLPKDDDSIPELNVTGKRIEGTIGELDTTKKDDDKKDDDIPEIVIDDKKDKGCPPGFHDDGTGLCVADDDTKKDTECPEGYVRDLETGQCVLPTTTKPPPIKCGEGFKLSADGKSCVPIVKTDKPIKCTEGFELSADGKSCVPIKKKTTAEATPSQGQNAPSQDPYANIKLMEELFGGDIAYKLRSLGAPQNLASADIDALERLLRG